MTTRGATSGPSSLAGMIVAELKKCHITHVVWLAHSEAGPVYDIALADPELTLVPVCREGEAVAVAAGLWMGGKNPVVLHQSTGLYDAGDSIRGLALDLRLPLLLLIGYRGWRPEPPFTDSAATFLEPILDAWGIKHYLLDSPEGAGKVSMAYQEAQEMSRPVAVLIVREGERRDR
ncbi:MAG: thiamine pyrophosphate-binding protein [Dehalococcoidia bacterium]